MKLLYEMIDDGIKKNIICFDADAKQGELTTFLIDVMIRIAEKNNLGAIKELFVPTCNISKVDFRGISCNMISDDFTNYFLSKDGCLVQDYTKEPLFIKNGHNHQDKYLVVAKCEKGTLLGSY